MNPSHCLLASNDAVKKSEIILIPDSLDAPCFPFLKLIESSYFEILKYPLIWITVISDAGYQVGPFSQDSCSLILGKFFWNYFLVLSSSCLFFRIFSENLFNFTNISNSNTNIISAIMLLISKNCALFFESVWVFSVCYICLLLPNSICFQNVCLLLTL